jgi:hypothetical protein
MYKTEKFDIQTVIGIVQVAGSCAKCSNPYSAGVGRRVIACYTTWEENKRQSTLQVEEDLFNICKDCYDKYGKPGQKRINQYK